LRNRPALWRVACAAGSVNFAPLAAIAPAGVAASVYGLGLVNKLMGQVNLTLAARESLRDRGSITLIAGILADQPIVQGSSASMVNGAVEAFARAAAIELPRGLRINVVSPTVFAESMEGYGPFFRGFEPVPVAKAALAFSRSIEGRQTGQVYKV
jgi:NAD(P)-dependent dehydrogenase (short-subunit alcohol dehydrogenase family)